MYHWVLGITVLQYYCSCMKLSKVTRKDHGCVWLLIRAIMFVLFWKRAIILKCIIMEKIPLFHHGVIGRLSCSTHLEPLPLISTCILYLKKPLFPICSSHPAPSCSTIAIPTAHNNHFCWVAIYIILPCIIYLHFLACFSSWTVQARPALSLVWYGQFWENLGCMWVTCNSIHRMKNIYV